MKTEPYLINIKDLKQGDIFSFRTHRTPIWWRFIETKGENIIYEEIKSKYRHTITLLYSIVLKK